MTDLAELRRLAEQATQPDAPRGPQGQQQIMVEASAILSLLDERDRLEKLVGPEWRGMLDDLRAAEQRVAALEEGLRGFVGPMEGPDGTGDEEQWWWNHPEWPDDEQLLGGTVGQYRKARQLLQASAQDASEGSGTGG